MSEHERYLKRMEAEQGSTMRSWSNTPDSPRSDVPHRMEPTGLTRLPRMIWRAGNAAISQLLGRKSGGKPLPPRTLTAMEQAFGADFGEVRIHEGPAAQAATDVLGAEAFTHGDDVYLGADAPALESPAGKKLLAHELAHVVQQKGREAASGPASVGPDNARLEAEARQAGQAIVVGRQVQVSPAPEAPAVQLQQRTEDPRERIIRLGESSRAEDRQRALDLVVDTYFRRPPTLRSIVYDPRFRSAPYDIETGFARLGQPQMIKVGPRFFTDWRRRFDRRARTIGHELQHVLQRSGRQPIQDACTREFLALYWTVTAQIPGLQRLGRAQTIEYINNPRIGALAQYRQMPREDQERYRQQYEHFQRMLRELESRRQGRSQQPARGIQP